MPSKMIESKATHQLISHGRRIPPRPIPRCPRYTERRPRPSAAHGLGLILFAWNLPPGTTTFGFTVAMFDLGQLLPLASQTIERADACDFKPRSGLHVKADHLGKSIGVRHSQTTIRCAAYIYSQIRIQSGFGYHLCLLNRHPSYFCSDPSQNAFHRIGAARLPDARRRLK